MNIYRPGRNARLTLTTAPAAEPLSTTDAKLHLRVDVSTDDAYIDTLVKAARLEVERRTGRALIDQTWTMKVPRFPGAGYAIEIPRAPLQSVTSVAYVDAAGDSQTWASSEYSVDAPDGEYAARGLIVPDYGVSYPSTQGHLFDVTIVFVAGYGGASAVPADLVQAIRLLVAHWYDTRTPVVVGTITATVPQSVTAILDNYRLDKVVVG